jgi:hypothetical protein
MSSKKTSSVTFRIDEDYSKSLRDLAEEQSVSLNTLVNQIFGKYVEQEVFTKKFGVLKVSTDTFRRILSKIPEKEIVELGIRAGSQEAKEFILFKWKKLNLQTVIEFLRFYFDYCGYGRADMEQTEGEVSLSVHHDLKEKGSLYLKHFVEGLIRTALDKSCRTTITEDTVTISFQA